jgi:hypothetical protein
MQEEDLPQLLQEVEKLRDNLNQIWFDGEASI